MQKQTELDSIPALINKTFPIPGRFRSALPSDIAELSRLLTNNRGERSLSYLSRPNYLSAYLHYFLPWNLYRLCILLPLLNINLSSDNVIADFGCGPLTFTTALWISRPDLRSLPLEFNCIDRSFPVLEAGKKIFTALSGETPWKINLIKKDVNIQKGGGDRRGKAALVCTINMFNEIYEHLSHNNTEGLRKTAVNAALFMHNEAAEDASILTVEPGVPQSGKFISLLRKAFFELGRYPLSPCTHNMPCPFNIPQTKKWCHFAFEAANAPKELKRLSAAARLPKERLVFSFLLTGAASQKKQPVFAAKTDDYSQPEQPVRVISDAFPLYNNQYGRYGCSARGLVLLAGEKSRVDKIASGSLFTSVFTAKEQRDSKSGALIMEV